MASPVVADSESTVTGRLTDTSGVALAGATILVFPAAPAEGTDPGACAQLRTDPDGGFVAFLPPGRYLVAAVKPGYDVSLTEVHSLASRVLRMRIEPNRGGDPRRQRTGRDLDWILRGERDDILRSEAPAIPPALLVARGDDSGPRVDGGGTDPAGSGAAMRVAAARPAGRDLFGAVDGQFVQSVGTGDLSGFTGGSAADGDRSTRLDLNAPINPRLAWDFAGATNRTEATTDEIGAPMGGGVDRLLAGATYQPAPGGSLAGAVHAGVGHSLAGSASGASRLLAAEGSFRPGAGEPIELGVRTWSTEIDPGDGRYLTFANSTPAAALEAAGESGVGLYAGSRHDFGPRTLLRYGVEYLDRGDLGRSAVPRVGMRQAIEGSADLAVEGELWIDPDRPGGRLALAATPGQGLRMTAALFVLPEYGTAAGLGSAPIGADFGGPGGASAVDPVGASRRAVDLSIARDFGPLSGHLAGGVGRTGARSTPAIEPGPLPIVSVGAEHWYETRLGVAWKPSRTEMQLGYRRVASDEPGDPGAVSNPDYRRLDLMVAQTLPSPRALLGADLRALLAWQEVSYDAWFAGSGAPTSGIASRLTGGVGLSF
ncbi:MAG TPA: carboxypeptidase-like regulatory domain-containing protein [Dongiaceae bacterium]|nr:carboxypeptidase-like regulatory domain-containing protein [Dongiaceae bacterium]